jgi:hypothetical protein
MGSVDKRVGQIYAPPVVYSTYEPGRADPAHYRGLAEDIARESWIPAKVWHQKSNYTRRRRTQLFVFRIAIVPSNKAALIATTMRR